MSDPASEDEIDDGSTEDVDWEQVQQLRMSKDVQVVESVRVIVRSIKKSEVKRNNLRQRTCAEFGEYSKKSDLVTLKVSYYFTYYIICYNSKIRITILIYYMYR